MSTAHAVKHGKKSVAQREASLAAFRGRCPTGVIPQNNASNAATN